MVEGNPGRTEGGVGTRLVVSLYSLTLRGITLSDTEG